MNIENTRDLKSVWNCNTGKLSDQDILLELDKCLEKALSEDEKNEMLLTFINMSKDNSIDIEMRILYIQFLKNHGVMFDEDDIPFII